MLCPLDLTTRIQSNTSHGASVNRRINPGTDAPFFLHHVHPVAQHLQASILSMQRIGVSKNITHPGTQQKNIHQGNNRGPKKCFSKPLKLLGYPVGLPAVKIWGLAQRYWTIKTGKGTSARCSNIHGAGVSFAS